MDTNTFIAQLHELGLWPQDEPAQTTIAVLGRKHEDDVRAFSRELLQQCHLTAYQVNLLLSGKGQQLLIGPYIVMERLGEGGMGQVFKACRRHSSLPVALKVIRPDRVTNPIALSRFLREVYTAAQLHDPNIVRAYDANKSGGTYYFAMEYVQGTDLAAFIKSRGPLPVDVACQLLNQAAKGLQHIHEQGMVHRDIKPGNLMLALEEAPAVVGQSGVTVRTMPSVLKILDLGLARLTEDSLQQGKERQLSLTHEGTIIGTADYMAPEQARASREADIRCDIYALGCTFYYALTGQVPFPGGSTVQKIMRHRSDQPVAVGSFRPHLPPLLAAILTKMMAKNASARFQTPAELVAALEPLVSAAALPPLAIPLCQAEEQTLSDSVSGATEPDLTVDHSPAAVAQRFPRGWIPVVIGALAGAFLILVVLLLAVILQVLRP